MKPSRRRHMLSSGFQHALLAFIAICFLLPLLWLIVASFDANASQTLKVPDQITLDNFAAVMSDHGNQLSFLVGLAISLTQSVFVVIIAGLAAYPLSRYRMVFKRQFMYTILFMTALPITAVMVPVYQVFLTLGLYDTISGVTIFFIASALPYAIWLMKNFMDSVPVELEEAAWVDGASVFRGLRTVIMPLMVPGICTVAVFTFSGSWGNFFVPYILMQTPNKLPASVKLYQYFGEYGLVSYGQLAAFSLLYACPSIILYILSQRFMSKGFSMQGASKG